MKLPKGQAFSVPNCILDDDLSSVTIKVLLYLIRISDFKLARANYQDIRDGAHVTSRSTVANSITTLKKHGWFHFVKKGGSQKTIYFMRVPPRFTETDDTRHAHLKVRLLPR